MKPQQNAVKLMLVSLVLWMFYPPIVDILLQKFEPFYLAAVIHTFAAVAIAIIVYVKLKEKCVVVIKNITKNKIFLYTLLAGLFICVNHLMLYYALSLTTNLDVVAILFFETWPLMFLFFDSVIRRNKFLNYKEVFCLISAFIGFLILISGNADFKSFSISKEFLNVAMFSFLGGISMALTCYMRIRCVDKWKQVSDEKSLNISNFNISLITEFLSRVVAAPLFIIVFILSDDSALSLNGVDFAMILFVGLFILAIGTVLYDLSIYLSSSASIGALWYLMPIGSIVLISIYQMKMLSFNEIISIAILISSNVIIAYNKKIKGSSILIYFSVCLIVLMCFFNNLLIPDTTDIVLR